MRRRPLPERADDCAGRRRATAVHCWWRRRRTVSRRRAGSSYELQRQLVATGAHTIAVAAHPGNAHTEVARHMPGWVRAALSPRLRPLNSWMMQSANMGSLPTLRAAVDPTATGGEYYGPAGLREFT